MPRMTFVDPQGGRRDIEAEEGMSLLEIAHANGADGDNLDMSLFTCSPCLPSSE